MHCPRAAFLAIALISLGAGAAAAQRRDSLRVAPAAPRRAAPDTLRPPLSPRRAFFYSALLPGYSQSVFGRNKSAALMLLVEATSIAMIRESAADVREARRFRGDSIVVTYIDQSTGTPATTVTVRRFDAALVKSRESHVEDWIALLVGNHLFSGAEAFVAANLWDIPGQFSIRPRPGGADVGASVTW